MSDNYTKSALSALIDRIDVMAWYRATDPLKLLCRPVFNFKNCPHIDKDNYKPGDTIDLNAMTAKCKECDIKDAGHE